MKNALIILQILLGVLVTVLVILQAKGIGLGRSFGSSVSYHSRRGVETLIFRLTILLTIIFVLVSVVNQFFV